MPGLLHSTLFVILIYLGFVLVATWQSVGVYIHPTVNRPVFLVLTDSVVVIILARLLVT